MVPITKTLELQDQALKVTPGPQSNLAGLWKGMESLFLVKGKEAHVWDIDGNEYIYYINWLRPRILGHAN